MLFNKLTSNILYSDDTCIVTGTDSNFQILLYDAKHFNPYLALDNQMNMRATEMIHLNINALEEGIYKIKHFTLDKENGALFNLWRKHHTIHGMDKDSIDYVNRMSFPKLEVYDIDVTDTLALNIKMITNGIHLIEVKRYPSS